MTREYARVKVAIWADADFRTLSDPAQALYLRLLSSPTMNLCGVADWRPKRIAALTLGVTAEGVAASAQELAGRGYVVIDEATEEILVRSFVRHDGLVKTPNIASAMAKDYAGTASATLRGVIVFELQRLKEDEPDMKGWTAASHLLSNPSVDPSGTRSAMGSLNPLDKGLANPSAMPSDKGSGSGSDIPQPSSLILQPAAHTDSATATKRGRRLPDGWQPADTLRQQIEHERPDLDLDREHENFCDYWLAKAGRDGLKLDWDATWRRWMREQQPRTKNQRLQAVPSYEPAPLREPTW